MDDELQLVEHGRMSQRQREFFAALCAPFPDDEIHHHSVRGKTLSYITNRILFNRLDDVAGPAGWYTEYVPTGRGYTCKLWIEVPDDDATGGYRWMFKSDGGGFAGMGEADNDEKSGYTDAAKRAGMVWGVARYLYEDGVPGYLAETAAPPATAAAPARSAPPQRQGSPPARSAAPARSAPPQRQAPPAGGNGGGGGGGGGGGKQYDNFKVPPPGKAVFAWAKGLEKVFGDGVVKEMDKIAKEFGYPRQYVEWDADQVEYVCWAAIDELKTWPCYNGEFDHLEDPRPDPQ